MQHAENDDALADNLIENLVGKTPKQHAAEGPVVEPGSFRVMYQFAHGGGHEV